MSNSFATPWTIAHQAPLSMEFPRQEYWSGISSPSPGIFTIQGSNPRLLHWEDSLPLSHRVGMPYFQASSSTFWTQLSTLKQNRSLQSQNHCSVCVCVFYRRSLFNLFSNLAGYQKLPGVDQKRTPPSHCSSIPDVLTSLFYSPLHKGSDFYLLCSLRDGTQSSYIQ